MWRCLGNMLSVGASQDEAPDKSKISIASTSIDTLIRTFWQSKLGVVSRQAVLACFAQHFLTLMLIKLHTKKGQFRGHLFEFWTILPLLPAIKGVCIGRFTSGWLHLTTGSFEFIFLYTCLQKGKNVRPVAVTGHQFRAVEEQGKDLFFLPHQHQPVLVCFWSRHFPSWL